MAPIAQFGGSRLRDRRLKPLRRASQRRPQAARPPAVL